MQNQYRIGIIGAGRIARVHCLALRCLPNVSITSIANRTTGHAHKLGNALNVNCVFPAMEDLCQSPEIDAIHICNANTGHFSALKLALENGKNILCEKPLASGLKETREIMRLAQASRSTVTVCYSYRFHPTTMLLNLNAHRIGKIRRIEIAYLQSSWLKQMQSQKSPDPKVLGDSYALAGIGSHALDMATCLAQSPLRLEQAVVKYAHEPRQCSDVDARLMLKTENKETDIVIEVSKVRTGIDNQFSIKLIGEKGEIYTSHLLNENIELTVEGKTQRIERSEASTPDDFFNFPAQHPVGWLSAFINLFATLYGTQPQYQPTHLPTLAESLHIAEIIDQALEDGDWIPLS